MDVTSKRMNRGLRSLARACIALLSLLLGIVAGAASTVLLLIAMTLVVAAIGNEDARFGWALIGVHVMLITALTTSALSTRWFWRKATARLGQMRRTGEG
jgi:hypothetical protein